MYAVSQLSFFSEMVDLWGVFKSPRRLIPTAEEAYPFLLGGKLENFPLHNLAGHEIVLTR
jgi:hypothetical protein